MIKGYIIISSYNVNKLKEGKLSRGLLGASCMLQVGFEMCLGCFKVVIQIRRLMLVKLMRHASMTFLIFCFLSFLFYYISHFRDQ